MGCAAEEQPAEQLSKPKMKMMNNSSSNGDRDRELRLKGAYNNQHEKQPATTKIRAATLSS